MRYASRLAAGGMRQGRFLGRREAQAGGWRAQRASLLTHCACLSEAPFGARSELRSAAPGLRSSPPQKSPLPHPARREPKWSFFYRRMKKLSCEAAGLCAGAAPVRRRAAQALRLRAKRAQQLTHRTCLSEAPFGARSELRSAAPGRAPQRSRTRSADRPSMSPCRIPPVARRET